jgi:hypothetical protein
MKNITIYDEEWRYYQKENGDTILYSPLYQIYEIGFAHCNKLMHTGFTIIDPVKLSEYIKRYILETNHGSK